jgi:hypothetical protein
MRSARPLIIAMLAAGCSSGNSNRAASVDTSAAGAPNSAVSPPAVVADEPTANDISNYKLDMDKMQKYSAAMTSLSALAKTDTSVAEAMGTHTDERTEQTITRLESNPRAVKVLKEAGLSAKDYVWITAAWLQAAMTAAAIEANKNAKLPEGQSTQNVEFVKAHKAELETLMKESGTSR